MSHHILNLYLENLLVQVYPYMCATDCNPDMLDFVHFMDFLGLGILSLFLFLDLGF